MKTKLIRIGSKILNPRAIIMCEPVKMWVYDKPEDYDLDNGHQIEALKIILMGQHELIISPEEWQGVKELLNITVAEPKPLPEPPYISPNPHDDGLPF